MVDEVFWLWNSIIMLVIFNSDSPLKILDISNFHPEIDFAHNSSINFTYQVDNKYEIIGSLRSYYGDAEDNVDWKMNFILPTNLAILLSHLLCLSLSKLSWNWIWDTAVNLKYNSQKLAVVIHAHQTTQNWSFHVVRHLKQQAFSFTTATWRPIRNWG